MGSLVVAHILRPLQLTKKAIANGTLAPAPLRRCGRKEIQCYGRHGLVLVSGVAVAGVVLADDWDVGCNLRINFGDEGCRIGLNLFDARRAADENLATVDNR